eukprot:CAMPEP_0178426512 /NCGR_PEP_ID=MMETSP0689_2-20121128/29272_1 /TAXON_ID=160604 /ORGANISM="Amphidinium massartii, Strain CS-259" /LENGTH=55 /DNA_ID=CAMNT_0020048199 /DNA_START=461 /DNA_END=625 /DNA_ORIENTATION=-
MPAKRGTGSQIKANKKVPPATRNRRPQARGRLPSSSLKAPIARSLALAGWPLRPG